jgi:hypothetical protein
VKANAAAMHRMPDAAPSTSAAPVDCRVPSRHTSSDVALNRTPIGSEQNARTAPSVNV